MRTCCISDWCRQLGIGMVRVDFVFFLRRDHIIHGVRRCTRVRVEEAKWMEMLAKIMNFHQSQRYDYFYYYSHWYGLSEDRCKGRTHIPRNAVPMQDRCIGWAAYANEKTTTLFEIVTHTIIAHLIEINKLFFIEITRHEPVLTFYSNLIVLDCRWSDELSVFFCCK